jgi:Ala-tRNA(Pro) deacylase
MPMADNREQQVYSVLERLNIRWERYEHPPVFTVEQAEEHWKPITATHCKNLFLRNQKGTTHYLVVLEHAKRADLKALASKIGDDRLSFASPERLQKYLGLTPGAVSPFGLIHSGARDVRVILDADLKNASTVAFHPTVNTATITLSFADFQRFLDDRGNIVRYISM